MTINQGIPSIRVNPLKGNGINTYCKITQREFIDGTKNKYTFAFGTGPRRYCLIVSIDGKDYSSAYIDRVDRLEKCSRGKSLTEIVEGTVKFIHLGLYAITKMCRYITRFTLKDDSKIICNGVNGPGIRFAYDYLLKYNMTWYQKKFGAQLDGLVGEEKVDKEVETLSPTGYQEIRVIKGSLMHQFLTSLKVLDEPCREYTFIRDLFPELEEYREMYENARSPRDFLRQVRIRFPDPASFCNGVYRWFDRYMGALRIQLFMDSWFIPVDHVQEPIGFAVGKPVNEQVLDTYHGGRGNTLNQKRGKRERQGQRGKTIRPLRGITCGIEGSVVESFGG